ncbi:MAG: glycosyltransferase family 39 protein [Thermoleophilaceae bacterium]
MSSVAHRARALPRLKVPPLGTSGLVALTGLLLLASLYVRTRALGASLWMDEGLSIGIASQPFGDIPTVLRQDGSPPLYYLLLHVWMSIFGNGPGDTQGLSMAISLLAVPGGLWAGWTLFNRRAGLICAALGAFNPFLTTYAQETRMYSLMVVLSLLTSAAFLHVYVFRDRRYLPVFAILLAAMLYTHSWGIFVTAGTLVALVPALMATEDRKAFFKDALIGFGAAAILYVPWLPTLLYQTAHTGAPWLNSPRFGAPVQISKSLLGGGTATVAILLGAGSGLAAVLATRGKPEESRNRTAVYTVLTLGVATLAIAWLFSQFSPAWTTRYLGVALGPIFLLASFGLSRAGNLGIVALAVVLGVWAVPHTAALENKSNVTDLAAAANPQLQQGDLVVTLQPEQQPLINYNLRGGLTHATELGRVKTEGVMDWRDSQERLEKATPQTNLVPLLDRLAVGQHVLLVHPVTSNIGDWDAPWTTLVRRRSAQWGQALELDRRFKRDEAVPSFYRRARRIGVRGVLYTKTSEL